VPSCSTGGERQDDGSQSRHVGCGLSGQAAGSSAVLRACLSSKMEYVHERGAGCGRTGRLSKLLGVHANAAGPGCARDAAAALTKHTSTRTLPARESGAMGGN
jgi:hypothetical protein